MKNNIAIAAALMGSSKSEAKTAAARSNGRKGGRPADPFKASLREAGIKWAWTANGLLKFYLRSGSPQRMRDGSFWNGTETVGEYSSWEQAKSCGSLAQTIEERR